MNLTLTTERIERVINKYVSSVDVKVVEITNDVKEYDVTVKLSKGGDKDNNYSFRWSNLSNYSYKPKTEFAERKGFEPSIRY